MAGRVDRLKRLLKVQTQLKAVHEMRHAGMVKAANAAGAEADEIAARKQDEGSLSTLFPDVFDRGMTRALARRDTNLAAAAAEAGRLATETVRTQRIADDYREARREAERAEEEREGLEAAVRMKARPRG